MGEATSERMFSIGVMWKNCEKFPYNQVDNKTKTFKFQHIIGITELTRVYGEGVYAKCQEQQ